MRGVHICALFNTVSFYSIVEVMRSMIFAESTSVVSSIIEFVCNDRYFNKLIHNIIFDW